MPFENETVLPLLDGEFVMESEITGKSIMNCYGGSVDSKISLNLFDRDGKILATKFGNYSSQYSDFIQRILSSPKCFTLTIASYGVPHGVEAKIYYFFETLYIIQHKSSNISEFGPAQPYDHSLTHEMLYTIKYFQLSLGNWGGAFDNPNPEISGHALHKFRPELFRSQSPEKVIFDKKTKSDKLKIELDQKEIQTKIEINKKIQTILEEKEIQIKEQETKLLEEKRKLFAVKQKLDLMKQELDMERDAFEKEKRKHEIKNIDLDDYFEIPVATVVATKVSPTIGEMIVGEFAEFSDL